MNFENLTSTNGFDVNDLNNARQNNYAWSMGELGEYIYVGTGRNVPYSILKGINPLIEIPALINPDPLDNRAEIWRYKKNGELGWERVYKAQEECNIVGFRYMIQYSPAGGRPCLYAATFGGSPQVLKTTNGVDWFIVQKDELQGTSSRTMLVQEKRLYVATLDETGVISDPLLYSSKDPEFYPWKLVIDPSKAGFEADKNPSGNITNMIVFNNKIYLVTSNDNGVALWRTNGEEPEMNEWTQVADKGFNNEDNLYSLSVGVFKNHLYIGLTKELPVSWLIPRGCDVVRVGKNDRWQLIVGGDPIIPLMDNNFKREKGLSGYGPGFDNPFNVYAWQIQEYKGKLLIATFDDSSNMELILNTILANRVAIEGLIGDVITAIIIEVYEFVVRILNKVGYPFGFDIYVSDDGIKFYPIAKRGLCNVNNYGGRILFVDSCNELYIGTANPFEGCEVWKTNNICRYEARDCWFDHKLLMEAKEKINEHHDLLC
ncbi:MAG: hypothetical protein RR645_07005, partial [Clostridium sp.]